MSEHAISNAKAWLADICETVKRLQDAQNSPYKKCPHCEGSGAACGEEEEDLCSACDGEGEVDRDEADCEEAILEEIQQGPLSIETRSGWTSYGGDFCAEEYRILMSTGGPALQIRGDLYSGSPSGTPSLQWQDWGTPWTDYETTEEEDSALDVYVNCFYFGD